MDNDAAATVQVATDVDLAFRVGGNAAAVFRPRFGQAHQQYFTPRWLAEAFL